MMKQTGHCYCGQLKYEAEGDPIVKGTAIAENASTSQVVTPTHSLSCPKQVLSIQKAPRNLLLVTIWRAQEPENFARIAVPTF